MLIRTRVERTIDYAHRLHNYDGKCSNVHGHTAKIAVEFEGTIDSETGMLADFKQLKNTVDAILVDLDHRFCVCDKDDMVKVDTKLTVFPFVPTAENMAWWIGGQINDNIRAELYQCVRVEFWETGDNCAIWQG